MSRVRESAKFIADNSSRVHVNAQNCKRYAGALVEQFKNHTRSAKNNAKASLDPVPSEFHVMNLIFTISLLNFSFWSPSDQTHRFRVLYKGHNFDGYFSCVAAIRRALDEGMPITSPTFWTSAAFSTDVLSYVFRSETNERIPLLEKRYDVLREAGEVMERLGHRDFDTLVVTARQSALKLVDILVKNFPSFNDIAMYRGREVQFYKRAQILVADLWACFEGKGPAYFYDISEITMFADYRVPEILCNLGCIEYCDSLARKLESYEMVEPGSQEEVEIRGCSIWAVEEILRFYKMTCPQDPLNAILLDYTLWKKAKEASFQPKIPHHRTRSIYY